MKINDPTSAGVNSASLGQTQAAESVNRGNRSGSSPQGGVSNDQVQLSDLASTVRALAADSPERAARIEQLTRAVQSGQYAVDANQVSASIVDSALSGF